MKLKTMLAFVSGEIPIETEAAPVSLSYFPRGEVRAETETAFASIFVEVVGETDNRADLYFVALEKERSTETGTILVLLSRRQE